MKITLLAILGAAAVTGFVFRDRIIAGALILVAKANQVSENVGNRLFRDDDADDEVEAQGYLVPPATSKEG